MAPWRRMWSRRNAAEAERNLHPLVSKAMTPSATCYQRSASTASHIKKQHGGVGQIVVDIEGRFERKHTSSARQIRAKAHQLGQADSSCQEVQRKRPPESPPRPPHPRTPNCATAAQPGAFLPNYKIRGLKHSSSLSASLNLFLSP